MVSVSPVIPFLFLFLLMLTFFISLYLSVCLTFIQIRLPYLLKKCLPYKTVMSLSFSLLHPLLSPSLRQLLPRLLLRETRAKKNEKAVWVGGGDGEEECLKDKRNRGEGVVRSNRDEEKGRVDERDRGENFPQRINQNYFTRPQIFSDYILQIHFFKMKTLCKTFTKQNVIQILFHN